MGGQGYDLGGAFTHDRVVMRQHVIAPGDVGDTFVENVGKREKL